MCLHRMARLPEYGPVLGKCGLWLMSHDLVLRLLDPEWELHLRLDKPILLTGSATPQRARGLAAAVGVAAGVLAHGTDGGGWLLAALLLAAIVVGIAQQTLP